MGGPLFIGHPVLELGNRTRVLEPSKSLWDPKVIVAPEKALSQYALPPLPYPITKAHASLYAIFIRFC